MLDPQARAFLDYIAGLNRPPMADMPLAEARALFEESFTRLGGPPVAVASRRGGGSAGAARADPGSRVHARKAPTVRARCSCTITAAAG